MSNENIQANIRKIQKVWRDLNPNGWEEDIAIELSRLSKNFPSKLDRNTLPNGQVLIKSRLKIIKNRSGDVEGWRFPMNNGYKAYIWNH